MPQIRKFEKIDNFSVFQGFDWNTNLSYTDKQGLNQTYDFKDINIFYGRNYSGKTSLSKIIRCLEKKVLPPKYSTPSFLIRCESSSFNQNQINSFNHSIHVYNSDFVKENLRFIHNEEDHIESFSVTLGGENQEILDRIQELKSELGSNILDNETGVHYLIRQKQSEVITAQTQYTNRKSELENHLNRKASGHPDSIRSQSQKFGDQNYNITKLLREIPLVQTSGFSQLTQIQIQTYESLITQRDLPEPANITTYALKYSDLICSIESTLKSTVGKSSKIDELVTNGTLSSWVQTGLQLHISRSTCGFCANQISEQQNERLRQHFDEETQKLQARIEKGIGFLESQLESSDLNIGFDINHYYTQYHHELASLNDDLQLALNKQKKSIKQLATILHQKKSKLFSELMAEYPQDYSTEIHSCLEKINAIRIICIQLTADLNAKQKDARNSLRLDHIRYFLQNINYDSLNKDIESLHGVVAPLAQELSSLNTRKTQILSEIKIEEDKLKSESEACTRINSILNHDFGHQALKLEPIEVDTNNGKVFRFEIQRNGDKAHNLSEGECSLISFCYFLAKIQDDLDQNKQPIIWIDDPICSLDSNHIFFIFSLIEEKICKQRKYKQLFISTHNLEFLKYLRRITGAESDRSIGFAAEVNRKASYYLIQSLGSISTIREMPIYLSKFLTEFNYLFDQIYRCATATYIDDSTYHLFYNFGNNARKFLEIYTFYKFPSPKYSLDKQLINFWGEDIYKNLTDRIHNEYSHICGVLERGGSITDQPEMQKSAKAIIYKIQSDINQYNAFLESIDVEIANDLLHPDNQSSL